jgi:SpoIIAA-like
MVTPLPQSTERVLGFKLSGTLHDDDYKNFVPVVDAAIAAHGKIRMLSLFEDFHGWDALALWDDTKFSTKHCADIEKLAIVGDQIWERWMAVICKPFTKSRIEYFDVKDLDRAWAWLAE